MDIKYINSTKDKLSLIPKVQGQIIYITDALESDNEIYVDFLDSTSQTVERYGMTQKNDAQVPLSSIMHIGGGTQSTVAEALNALKNNDVSLPLATSQGGTGNTTGHIQAGKKAGTTIGHNATAEGYNVTASASYAHAEGNATNATGLDAHAEGNNTTASAPHAHAEGENSIASQQGAHAEGRSTQANNWYAHSEGMNTIAGYMFQHVGGKYNDNKADTLFEIGNGTGINDRSNAFEVYSNGDINVNGNIRINGSIMPIGGGVTSFNGRSGSILPVGGDYTASQVSYGNNSNVNSALNTLNTKTTGMNDGYVQVGQIDGYQLGEGATAEGLNTCAGAKGAHAEGSYYTRIVMPGTELEQIEGSHADGEGSHAEGMATFAASKGAHSEGSKTQALGFFSHAEGDHTYANGDASHTEGYYTEVNYDYQHAGGKYNDNKSETLLEIGNGTSENARSNAFEVYTDGHINVNGDIYQNGSLFPRGGVQSFNGRSGSILPIGGDYSADQITYSGNVTTKAKIDEVAGVWTTPVSCAVGDTTCTISNSSITTTSTIRVFGSTSSGKPVRWKQITTTTGQAVITFTSALTEASSVKLHVLNI